MSEQEAVELKPGWPIPISERHEPDPSSGRCARCWEDESRLNGFCSVYCQDMDEFERALEDCQQQASYWKSVAARQAERIEGIVMEEVDAALAEEVQGDG